MCFFRFLTSAILTVTLTFSSLFTLIGGTSVAKISVDTTELGNQMPNIVSNVNVWDMGTSFYNPIADEENNVFDFVKYVQLMQCTGGTADRDLFIDPYNTSTYTDYDFSSLIKNCEGILSLGAKPHLKLGGIPLKFTKDYKIGGFEMNLYPPDNYELYYEYIKAIAQNLIDVFGIEEVKTWRFGCMTEYENGDWFQAKSGNPDDTAKEYCKLYDYTVQALIDVIGDDVFVGAHGMIVTEGLWDESIFIKHVAQGTNYANGKIGSHINFLSASFYDNKPGKFTSGIPLDKTIESLQKTAKKYGLNDLIYGVDEGRILYGNTKGNGDNQLLSRTVGYTWQAAYDARLFTQAINCGMDYFSSWQFLSGGLLTGNPTVSYHVAKSISKFAGSRIAKTDVICVKTKRDIDIDSIAGWDEDNQTLQVMAYNFRNDVNYNKSVELKFSLNVPQFDNKEITIIKYVISDDCNYFDEWVEDRKTYGIDNDCFFWSPDDGVIESNAVLNDENARKIYFSQLKEKYKQCSKLCPVKITAKVDNGKIKFNETISASNVVFYQISES